MAALGEALLSVRRASGACEPRERCTEPTASETVVPGRSSTDADASSPPTVASRPSDYSVPRTAKPPALGGLRSTSRTLPKIKFQARRFLEAAIKARRSGEQGLRGLER
jgi:hypothetical protein